MIGTYRAGTSVLHRIPAGPKLTALVVAVLALSLWSSWWLLGAAAAGVAVLYAIARFPPVVLWQQLRPLRWFLPLLMALQWWTLGWRAAVVFGTTLVIAVALAALLTLTTRVSAMLDLCVRLLRPVRRFVDPDRVGLVLAMTIRAVPVLVTIVGEVRQARIARGVGFSVRALAVPVVVRALRRADALGDALVARGADD